LIFNLTSLACHEAYLRLYNILTSLPIVKDKADKYLKLERAHASALINVWNKVSKEALNEIFNKIPSEISDDAFEIITEGLNKHLGYSFGHSTEVNKLFKQYIGDTYTEGKKEFFTAETLLTTKDKHAINVLTKHNCFWLGEHYGKHIGPKIAEMTQHAIENGLGRMDLAKELRDALGGKVGGYQYWDIVASSALVRSRAFGCVAGMEEAGITEYEIMAMGDERMCPICGEMDGRVFSVAETRELINRVLEIQDPEAFKEAMPWQTESPRGKSNSELQEAGMTLPPYHARCRCTLVMVGTHVVAAPKTTSLALPQVPDNVSVHTKLDELNKLFSQVKPTTQYLENSNKWWAKNIYSQLTKKEIEVIPVFLYQLKNLFFRNDVHLTSLCDLSDVVRLLNTGRMESLYETSDDKDEKESLYDIEHKVMSYPNDDKTALNMRPIHGTFFQKLKDINKLNKSLGNSVIIWKNTIKPYTTFITGNFSNLEDYYGIPSFLLDPKIHSFSPFVNKLKKLIRKRYLDFSDIVEASLPKGQIHGGLATLDNIEKIIFKNEVALEAIPKDLLEKHNIKWSMMSEELPSYNLKVNYELEQNYLVQIQEKKNQIKKIDSELQELNKKRDLINDLFSKKEKTKANEEKREKLETLFYEKLGELLTTQRDLQREIFKLKVKAADEGVILGSKLYETLSREYKSYYDDIIERVQRAPVRIRRFWNIFEDKLNIIDDKHKYSIDRPYLGCYEPKEKGIYFNLIDDFYESRYSSRFRALFHEFAHLKDYAVNSVSRVPYSVIHHNGAFERALRADWKKFCKSTDKPRAKMLHELSDVVERKCLIYISDIVDGLTYGEFNLDGHGHGVGHWKNSSFAFSEESFANWISAAIAEPLAFEIIKYYFPSAVPEVDDMLDTIVKQYTGERIPLPKTAIEAESTLKFTPKTISHADLIVPKVKIDVATEKKERKRIEKLILAWPQKKLIDTYNNLMSTISSLKEKEKEELIGKRIYNLRLQAKMDSIFASVILQKLPDNVAEKLRNSKFYNKAAPIINELNNDVIPLPINVFDKIMIQIEEIKQQIKNIDVEIDDIHLRQYKLCIAGSSARTKSAQAKLEQYIEWGFDAKKLNEKQKELQKEILRLKVKAADEGIILGSKLYETLSREYKSYYDEIIERVQRAPVRIRRLWNVFEDKLKIGNDKSNERVGQYIVGLKYICFNFLKEINPKDDKLKFGSIYHEFAHLMDNLSDDKPYFYFSYSFNQGAFERALRADWEKFCKKCENEKLQELLDDGYPLDLAKNRAKDYFKDKIIRELSSKFKFINPRDNPLLYSFSDILEAVSDCALRLGAGHGKEYWEALDDAVSFECFAQIIEISITVPEVLEVIKYFFPTGYKEFENVVDAIVEKMTGVKIPLPVMSPVPAPTEIDTFAPSVNAGFFLTENADEF